MIESANRSKPRRWRGEILVALFATTVILAGGAQALSPAPAAALNTEGCGDFFGVSLCGDTGGGGSDAGPGDGSGSAGDQGPGTAGSDQSAGQGTGASADQSTDDGKPQGEVIVVTDTKPVGNGPADGVVPSVGDEMCGPEWGRRCKDDQVPDRPPCNSRRGYLCPAYCPYDNTWTIDECDPPIELIPSDKPAADRKAGKVTMKWLMKASKVCEEARYRLQQLQQVRKYFREGPGLYEAEWKKLAKAESVYEKIIAGWRCDEYVQEM